MIAQLTRNERHYAIVIMLVLAACGLTLGGAGQDDPLGAHGFLIMAAAIGGIFWVISGYFAPEPPRTALDSYYDDPSKVGIVIAMAWAVFGMFVGDWVAWLLAYPDLTFDAGWSSFGRLRPVHTTGVIFGFGGNGLIATSFYVMQRTSRARLPDQLSPWFVLFGYNLFCVLAVTGYLMGITQSKEYAEPEWYADIWLVIVWVTYFVRLPAHAGAPQGAAHLRRQLVLHGVHPRRRDAPHRQQPRGAGVARAAPRAIRSVSGVQDAMTQWWYGHNAVAFFLTAGFLGMMYYYLPKRRRAADLLLPAVDHQLLGNHLPLHVGGFAPPALHGPAAMGADARHDLLGDAAGAVLGLRGQRAADPERRVAQGARRRDAALHDGRGRVLRADHLRGLVHGDPAGQLAVALHRLDGRPRPCRRARLGGDDHLRLDLRVGAVALEARERCIRRGWSRCISGSPWPGTVVYVFAMWNSGIIQGLMWRTYNGTARSPIRSSIRWSRCTRTTSPAPSADCCSCSAPLVGCYNIWMTVRGAPARRRAIADEPRAGLVPGAAATPGE